MKPVLTLGLIALYFAVAFGWRSWRQWRRTGSTGFRGISGRPFSAEWTGGVLFVVAMVLVVISPVAQALGMPSIWEGPTLTAIGFGLVAMGFVGTLGSQLAMGDSWRIGVNVGERTAFVTSGPFRWVRNPIFTSMAVSVGGLVLLTPNLVTLCAFSSLVLALELQVRLVEEPYLARTHGPGYAEYAARVGRFVPKIGRITSSRA